MIILASRSKARRKILKDLGISFRVVVARVKEHGPGAGPPARIAKANALLKARDAAGRVRRGIVVACDTLVCQGKKIYGKPRDLADARRMLAALSRRPHRLYTGIAVIDARSGREIVDVEETRIVMEPLTRSEIGRYFKKVSPLDKAGAFDIRGRGGLFIRRIEGCYFNVVGLPVARMARMLKKFGVSLLVMVWGVALGGCATEFNVATKRQDLMVYSTDQEVKMGRSLSAQIEKHYTVIQDPELNDRLDQVAQRVTAVCDRKELLYRFGIIEDEEDKDMVNAVSLPGGYIYVFKNLMKTAETDDELAAVVAHEVAHVVARHSIKRLQAIWGYNALTLLAVGAGDPELASGVQQAYLHLLMGYSQEDELTADQIGARYTKEAGYDPEAMITFLEKLRQIDKKESPRSYTYWRTHPYVSSRIRTTKQEIGEQISFEDYINTP